MENYYKSVIAMESAHIALHTKTLKLLDIEISRRTLLCFVWLVLCLTVNYNTRFSGLTNTWLKSYPQMLNMVGTVQLLTPSKLWEVESISVLSHDFCTGCNESIFA